MGSNTCDELVMELGAAIIRSDDYEAYDWAGLTVVGHFSNGEQKVTGYVYLPNGKSVPETPSFDALNKIRDLQDAMKQEKGESWHQCLIHITRPDFKLNIQFEYEDPRRWSPKKVSMDMSEYAESIKPPSLAAQG